MAWWRKRRSSPSRAEHHPSSAPSHRRDGADDAVARGGTVTGIQFQARAGSERVNVYLDGGFAFSLAADVGLPLREGQELDPAAIHELLAHDQAEVAYQRALHFLAPRPRSGSEVRRRLLSRGHEAEIINSVMERLERNQLVDDRAFSTYWVSQRQTFRPRGPRALRAELRAKGVDAEMAGEVISAAAEEQDEAAYRAGRKKAAALRAYDQRAFGQVL